MSKPVQLKAKWKNQSVPDVVAKCHVEACVEQGWQPVDATPLFAQRCTGNCGRERGKPEQGFFTCDTCRAGITHAGKSNTTFHATKIEPVRHDCVGGCGRYLVSAADDEVKWMCCPTCKESIQAFIRKMNGEKKQIVRNRGYKRSRTCSRHAGK